MDVDVREIDQAHASEFEGVLEQRLRELERAADELAAAIEQCAVALHAERVRKSGQEVPRENPEGLPAEVTTAAADGGQ